MENKTILIISTEPWGKNFVSKHHYAHYLSQKNTVYFLNPPHASNKTPFKAVQLTIEHVTPSLTAASYTNILPRLNHFPLSVQRRIYKKQAKQIQKALGIAEFDLIWSFDPYRFFDQTVWKAKKCIYHVVDFHLNSKHESIIHETSTTQIVVSFLMKDNFQGDKANMHRIGHGFAAPKPTDFKPVIPGSNKTKAVYVGNINGLREPERFCRLADQNPAVDFILIGPYKPSNLSTGIVSKNYETLQRDNIYLIGSIPAENIHPYLIQCDISLLIMKGPGKDPKTNSHKLMGYFFAGQVVLSDYLLDYKNESEQLIHSAKSAKDFETKFSLIIKDLATLNSEENRKFRIDYAQKNSYIKKIEAITELIYGEND